MASKPGRPPVKTSFKKGNTASLGNDKTLRISTWIDKALDKPVDLEGYDQAMTARQAMAEDFVKQYFLATTIGDKSQVLDRLANRTEGMPKQSTDITSGGEKIVPIFGGKSVQDDDSN